MNCEQPFSILEESSLLDTLKKFHELFNPIVTISILIFSLFSLISNILIVIVLLHREMRRTGINNLMMVMSASNWFCTVFGFLTLLGGDVTKGVPLAQALVPTFSFYLTVAMHLLSINMAVGMAFCRIMSLTSSGKASQDWQSSLYAVRVSMLLFIVTFLFSIPYVLLIRLKRLTEDLYTLEIVMDDGCSLLKSVFLLNGIVMKLIPCILIAVFSIIILRAIREGRRRRRKTLGSRLDKIRMDRSSDLILMILVIFLITEIPQVGYSFFGAVFTRDYYVYIGPQIGSVFDLLSLMNSASSIVIYCMLSSKFRTLFCRIFFRRKNSFLKVQSTTDASRF